MAATGLTAFRWRPSIMRCGFTDHSELTIGCSTNSTQFHRQVRGLAAGSIYNAEGHLAINVVQEGLIRLER